MQRVFGAIGTLSANISTTEEFGAEDDSGVWPPSELPRDGGDSWQKQCQ